MVENEKDGAPEESPATNNFSDEEQIKDEEEVTRSHKIMQCLWQFYWANEFLILVVSAILLARAYPPLGADYLQPRITATWIAVVFIFCKCGVGL